MFDPVRHSLQERVKELTALHGTARLLQDARRSQGAVMADVVALLPPAWQFPDIATAAVRLGDGIWTTPGHAVTPWVQREEFRLGDGTLGAVEIAYREARTDAGEGPFLPEERELIRSLAEMLRAYWQHRQDDEAIVRANERLEVQVEERTAALRQLASELCLTEARERRAIAEDLHDHLGQALAFTRARLRQLQGDAVFGGHEAAIVELVTLLDQAIQYTRTLTFELSPPILYELGLGPALDWLGEQFATKHGLPVAVRDRGPRDLPDDLRVLYFKSARELLHNVVKHARATRAVVELEGRDGALVLTVIDDGRGLPPGEAVPSDGRFGLFSIEERLRQLGGRLQIAPRPGGGTVVRLTAELPQEGAR